MTTKSNRTAYFRSLSDELLSQAQRVRDLIGDAHWLSDGHHKEYLLSSLIQRHVPGNILVTRGFISDPATAACSKEQDILILDTTLQGPLFHQGGLAVALPCTVMASISVKSVMRRTTIADTMVNQQSVVALGRTLNDAVFPIFSAGYFFDIDDKLRESPTQVYSAYANAVAGKSRTIIASHASPPVLIGPAFLCAGRDLVYRARADEQSLSASAGMGRILGYHCEGLALAILLSMLLDHIAAWRSRTSIDLPQLVEHEDIQPLEPPCQVFPLA